MTYRYGIWHVDMVIYHVDMVILDIDMGYGRMIWQMTVAIRSSPISKRDILSLWQGHSLPHCVHIVQRIARTPVCPGHGKQGGILVPPHTRSRRCIFLSFSRMGKWD